MTRIAPVAVRYIKLGKGGIYEKQCIEADQTVWLGYRSVPHKLCAAGDWAAVHRYLVEDKGDSPGTATRHVQQISAFYESGEDDLWVAFYADRLWWGFAAPEITVHPDNSKTRPIVGGWRSTNINGDPLTKSRLSGYLLSVEGYRGAICNVTAADYLIRKINGETSDEERAVAAARVEMQAAIEKIIDHLHWKDFELLIDLIFRAACWQRVSETGGPQKTVDMVLTSPILGESYTVQVKSRAGRDEFEQYVEQTRSMNQFTRHYFVVHKPQGLTKDMETDSHKLWLQTEIADLVVRYGLVDWIIGKAI